MAEDMEHVLSGYIESLVSAGETFQVYFPGGCIGLKVAYFEEKYPGLLLGTGLDDNEVAIPLLKITAVQVLDEPIAS